MNHLNQSKLLVLAEFDLNTLSWNKLMDDMADTKE